MENSSKNKKRESQLFEFYGAERELSNSLYEFVSLEEVLKWIKKFCDVAQELNLEINFLKLVCDEDEDYTLLGFTFMSFARNFMGVSISGEGPLSEALVLITQEFLNRGVDVNHVNASITSQSVLQLAITNLNELNVCH